MDILNLQYNIMQHFDCIPAIVGNWEMDERKYLMDWTDWLDYSHIFFLLNTIGEMTRSIVGSPS